MENPNKPKKPEIKVCFFDEKTNTLNPAKGEKAGDATTVERAGSFGIQKAIEDAMKVPVGRTNCLVELDSQGNVIKVYRRANNKIEELSKKEVKTLLEKIYKDRKGRGLTEEVAVKTSKDGTRTITTSNGEVLSIKSTTSNRNMSNQTNIKDNGTDRAE